MRGRVPIGAISLAQGLFTAEADVLQEVIVKMRQPPAALPQRATLKERPQDRCRGKRTQCATGKGTGVHDGNLSSGFVMQVWACITAVEKCPNLMHDGNE